MSDQTRERFIQAGLELYPQYGYRLLSVRLLAERAGLSSGMFHHLFKSKDDFFEQMLKKHNPVFAAKPHTDTDLPPDAALRAFIAEFSRNLEADLPWVLRLTDDCAEGAEVVRAFVQEGLRHHFAYIESLLRAALSNDGEADYQLKRKFIILTTLAPVLLGSRFASLGILPLSAEQMKLTSDSDAKRRWQDWIFAAVLDGKG